MRSKLFFVSLRTLLALAAAAGFLGNSGFAQTKPVRVAVVPFSAPDGNARLQQAADALPDMLTAALPQDGNFQLVERQKINSIWNEMHLNEAGLISADTVAKFGQLLDCDWLVNGSLAVTESGTNMWIKIIDTQSGVVLDLQSFPFNTTDFSANAQAAADFLAGTRSRTRPREFVTLERFTDQTPDGVTLEDWTPRLKVLIEGKFLKSGYGVVERDAVGPIFSEYLLQSAGMTAGADKHVKLKPAFWMMRGNWAWISGSPDTIRVSMRISRMGGGEQSFSITNLPGGELENALAAALHAAMKDAGSATEPEALAAEQRYHAAQIEQMAKGRDGGYAPSRFDTNAVYVTVTNPMTGEARQMILQRGFQAQMEGHKEAMLKSLQQAILLNPNDLHAKLRLGMALFGSPDPVESKQSDDMLKEVAASNDPRLAAEAKTWLERPKNDSNGFGMAAVLRTATTNAPPPPQDWLVPRELNATNQP